MTTKTATFARPTRSFFDRVLSLLDQVAELAAKNGDVTYFGL